MGLLTPKPKLHVPSPSTIQLLEDATAFTPIATELDAVGDSELGRDIVAPQQ